MKSIIRSLFELITFILLALLQAFVFTKCWNWFIVPTFDLTILTLIQGWGIILVLKVLTIKLSKEVFEDKATTYWKITRTFLGYIVLYFFALGFSYLVSLFL